MLFHEIVLFRKKYNFVHVIPCANATVWKQLSETKCVSNGVSDRDEARVLWSRS